jgi:periplasmic copper chaperone A
MKLRFSFDSYKWFLTLLLLSLISTNSFASSIIVISPYARAVPPGHPNSAVFMKLKNTSNVDRALIEARSSVSKVVELHTHKKEGGMMRMRRVDKITIKAGDETVLQPGGLHVMLIGLKQQLHQGNMIDLELIFDDNSNIKLTLLVKAVAGMGNKKPKH